MENNRIAFGWPFFQKVPVIGILRGIALSDVMQILPLCITSGLKTIEITMNSSGAEDIIKQAVKKFGESINIGAGTVCNLQDLDLALKAGASFIVSPNLDEQVITKCVSNDIPVFPGAFTPTEIYKAWDLGATMVKVFPADTLGPKFISNLKAPYSNIKLLPTGGIDATNVREFFKAGASGVGVSGGLFDQKLIAHKQWDLLSQHLQEFSAQLETKN